MFDVLTAVFLKIHLPLDIMLCHIAKGRHYSRLKSLELFTQWQGIISQEV